MNNTSNLYQPIELSRLYTCNNCYPSNCLCLSKLIIVCQPRAQCCFW